MSEGFHIEVPESQTNVDSRSVVEKGEIVSTKHLEGYWPMSIASFKTGESAIFKATDDKLEVLVSVIDSLAGFNLVPSVAIRSVNGSNGLIQHIPNNSQLAVYFSNWKDLVSHEELTKAAVFDFALGANTRTPIDFLVSRDSKRVFLINNDSLMLLEYERKENSTLLSAANEKGPVNISKELLTGFQRVIDSEGKLREGLDEQESGFVDGFMNRAKLLLKNKTIS